MGKGNLGVGGVFCQRSMFYLQLTVILNFYRPNFCHYEADNSIFCGLFGPCSRLHCR